MQETAVTGRALEQRRHAAWRQGSRAACRDGRALSARLPETASHGLPGERGSEGGSFATRQLRHAAGARPGT